MPSSAKEAEAVGAVAEEDSVVAEAVDAVDRAPRDKPGELNSPAGLWVLRSGLRGCWILHWAGNEVFPLLF